LSTFLTHSDQLSDFLTLAASNGTRNATVWRPSVCLSRRHTYHDLPGAACDVQRTFQPGNKDDWNTCYILLFMYSARFLRRKRTDSGLTVCDADKGLVDCPGRGWITYIDSTSNYINSLRRSITSNTRCIARPRNFLLPTDVSRFDRIYVLSAGERSQHGVDARFVQHDLVFPAHSGWGGGRFLRSRSSQ